MKAAEGGEGDGAFKGGAVCGKGGTEAGRVVAHSRGGGGEVEGRRRSREEGAGVERAGALGWVDEQIST